MWLDGLYMAEPFYAEYASISHHPEISATSPTSLCLMEEHARDPKTGLLYHGWDESKQERWANQQTGDSSQFWARGMGWYMMALVDTLDYYPADDPGAQAVDAILNAKQRAVARFQDHKDRPLVRGARQSRREGQLLESSASCMFVYAFAKGVRRGYLPEHFLANAERGYKGILSHFVEAGPGGDVSLDRYREGLRSGRRPYRDGSYAYYIGEKVVTNDPKGVGAFLLASTEMETAQNARSAAAERRGRRLVQLQQRPTPSASQVYFHYKWDTMDKPRLLALRPPLPQIRRGTKDARCRANCRQSSRRAGLHHRLTRQPR